MTLSAPLTPVKKKRLEHLPRLPPLSSPARSTRSTTSGVSGYRHTSLSTTDLTPTTVHKQLNRKSKSNRPQQTSPPLPAPNPPAVTNPVLQPQPVPTPIANLSVMMAAAGAAVVAPIVAPPPPIVLAQPAALGPGAPGLAAAVAAAGAFNVNTIEAALVALVRVDRGVVSILPGMLTLDLDALIGPFGINIDQTGAIKASILVALTRIGVNQPFRFDATHAANITMTTSPAVAGGNPAVLGSSAQIANIEDNDNGTWLRSVINNVTAANQWLVDLVATQQVRGLTAKNIQGYFLSKGNTVVAGKEIKELIWLIATGFPDMMVDVRLRALLTGGDWMKYHTTASSSASLVAKFISSVHGAFPGMVGAASVALVNLAVANPWDKAAQDAVPGRLKGVAHVFLEASNSLPDNWYQGTRAREDMPPNLVASYMAFFKKFLLLSRDIAAINAATDMTTLLTAMPASLVGL